MRKHSESAAVIVQFCFTCGSCLLTQVGYSPPLLFGLFVHQNIPTLTQWQNKQNRNFGSTIYIGNFTFIWQLYHISANCRLSIQLGSVDA